jgi:hypothetical protein
MRWVEVEARACCLSAPEEGLANKLYLLDAREKKTRSKHVILAKKHDQISLVNITTKQAALAPEHCKLLLDFPNEIAVVMRDCRAKQKNGLSEWDGAIEEKAKAIEHDARRRTRE